MGDLLSGIKRAASWATNAEKDLETGDLQLDENSIEVSKQRFLDAILNQSSQPVKRSPLFPTEFQWYCTLLASRARLINQTHLEPCLTGQLCPTLLDPEQNLPALYRIMTTVANMVATERDLSLANIVHELKHRKMIRTNDQLTLHLAVQLVFMLLGWLTMLYDPKLDPDKDRLQIETVGKVSSRLLRSQALHSHDQNFEQVHQPLTHMFRIFGNIIPQPDLTVDPSVLSQQDCTGYLMVSYLSYHTLAKVAKIKIEWVDSLSLHLEFVESRRVLKVFRFPSFCQLVYSAKGNQTFLSRLFASRLSLHEDPFANPTNMEPREFLREVLLSYRLIFGQDRRAWKAFRKLWKRTDGVFGDGGAKACDPLLERLCGHSWQDEIQLYEELDAHDVPNHYSPSQDFPFLGRRLLRVQDFTKMQNPQDWRVLWSDRRDIMRFYTFSGVFATLFVTILVGILQIVIAAVQLAASYEQNRLQALSLHQSVT